MLTARPVPSGTRHIGPKFQNDCGYSDDGDMHHTDRILSPISDRLVQRRPSHQIRFVGRLLRGSVELAISEARKLKTTLRRVASRSAPFRRLK